MRTFVLVALLLAAPLAGCLGQDDAQETPPTEEPPARPDRGESDTPPSNPQGGIRAPVLEPGTSFTFTTTGIYDGEEEITVVVAESTTTGYLLAGASEEDLATEILWERRYLGPVDKFLTPLGDDGAPGSVLFAFPLWAGKTWAFGDGTATAQVDEVPGPNGPELGIRVTTEGTGANFTWTYSPTAGFLSSFVWESDGRLYEEATLTGVGTSDTWVWYETLERYETEDPVTPVFVDAQEFQPPEDAEGIVASMGGTTGARIVVQPSPAAAAGPFSFEVTEDEEWATRVWASAPGVWGFSTFQPEEGFAWAALAAVKWVRP